MATRAKPAAKPRSGPEIPAAVPVHDRTVWIIEYNNKESATEYYECWVVAETEDGAEQVKKFYENKFGKFGTVRSRELAVVDGTEERFAHVGITEQV